MNDMTAIRAVAASPKITMVDLDKLVITKPRVLYGRQLTKQFVYGKNVKTLEFKRRLGRKKGFNIRTTSLNVKDKVTEEAKIPKDATTEWSDEIGLTQEEITIPQINADGTKGEDKPAPYITFSFPNMTKKQLIECGQKIFEEVAGPTRTFMPLTSVGSTTFLRECRLPGSCTKAKQNCTSFISLAA